MTKTEWLAQLSKHEWEVARDFRGGYPFLLHVFGTNFIACWATLTHVIYLYKTVWALPASPVTFELAARLYFVRWEQHPELDVLFTLAPLPVVEARKSIHYITEVPAKLIDWDELLDNVPIKTR